MSHLLFKAAQTGDVRAPESLLAGGANIEWTHKGTGRTALVEAAINGHRDAVAVLLRRGAAIDHQCTALGYDHSICVEELRRERGKVVIDHESRFVLTLKK